MRLREWKYMNTPNSNTTSASTSSGASASSAGNKSFKKRFDKLIQYYGQHLPAEVDYVMVNLLTNDTLDFTENFDDGDKARFNISINLTTEAWTLKYYVNGGFVDSISDTGWPELLKTLNAGYITELPHAGTPEYNNLLTEWVAMNNKASSTSSSGYKKRFEKLIKYHIDHASSELESITRKDIFNYSFRFSEHYSHAARPDGYDRDIIVSVDHATDTFYLNVFIDHKEVENNNRIGWENFIKLLGNFMWLPRKGTPDYDDLLTESLNEWQLMNPPKASQPASTKTNKEKFTELVTYMQKHKDSSTIFTSVNGPNDTGFEYEEQRASANESEYNLSVEVSLGKHDLFTIHVDKDGKRVYTIMAKGWEELLRYLRIYFHAPNMGSPEYTSLTESFSSELKEWKYIKPPQPTSNTESQKYRYERLLAQIDADGISTYTVNKLTDSELDLTVSTKYRQDLHVRIIYNPNTDDYIFTAGSKTLKGNNDFEEDILTMLVAAAVIKNTDLCESTSIAEDFKTYENLWD